jgi:hypothetical protein
VPTDKPRGLRRKYYKVARFCTRLPLRCRATTHPHQAALAFLLEIFNAISPPFTNFIPMLVYKTCGRPTATGTDVLEAFMSLIERLHRAKAELSEGEEDPWRRALERALPANLACTSTVALLSLLDFPATTANSRRLARTMRSMGWVGIKSRRLAPGGWRTTTCRGWARPFREPAPGAKR